MAVKGKVINNPYTGQSIKFLQTSKDTHGSMLEMESSFEPYSRPPAPHYHPFQEEEFKVISGELTVQINGLIKSVKAGETLVIPKSTVHSMWNCSAGKTVVNWKVTPALNTENLFETGMGLAMSGRAGKDGMPLLLQGILLADRYSSEYRLARPGYRIQKIVFTILKPLALTVGYKAVYKEYID